MNHIVVVVLNLMVYRYIVALTIVISVKLIFLCDQCSPFVHNKDLIQWFYLYNHAICTGTMTEESV